MKKIYQIVNDVGFLLTCPPRLLTTGIVYIIAGLKRSPLKCRSDHTIPLLIALPPEHTCIGYQVNLQSISLTFKTYHYFFSKLLSCLHPHKLLVFSFFAYTIFSVCNALPSPFSTRCKSIPPSGPHSNVIPS